MVEAEVSTTPSNTITNSEIETRKLFNIVCSCDTGNININEGQSGRDFRTCVNVEIIP